MTIGRNSVILMFRWKLTGSEIYDLLFVQNLEFIFNLRFGMCRISQRSCSLYSALYNFSEVSALEWASTIHAQRSGDRLQQQHCANLENPKVLMLHFFIFHALRANEMVEVDFFFRGGTREPAPWALEEDTLERVKACEVDNRKVGFILVSLVQSGSFYKTLRFINGI